MHLPIWGISYKGTQVIDTALGILLLSLYRFSRFTTIVTVIHNATNEHSSWLSFCVNVFSILLDIYLGVELLDHRTYAF